VSTSTSLFPDVNVWVALAHAIHPHHTTAAYWERALPPEAVLCFCRFTQLGLLRLLTNRTAMREDVLYQVEAWRSYDSFVQIAGARLIDEPHDIDPQFRRLSDRKEASTKQWADGYLAAFAETAGLTLVTFDRALAGQVKGAILLS
jgi:toxin-antitoxin system PIN domain toxin